MSNMKNGFTTLNRWLGKKNKDKTAPNSKLSKSNANLNLSISSTNINETSQLEYNRITPLPAATSNAPFEQTFRITVLLPKDQLYVTRLGARVPLSKLLELISENKLLDAEKYEFRNPVDSSQVYGCDLTIGAVGLSEIRLCLKSESYDTFNTDEAIKLHRTLVIRDSLSSSEFSSRNSKHTTKTASPYSSSNSLNSMDSTGMNYTRTPVTPPSTLPTANVPQKAVAAPPRKKRAAPRPPSHTAIPEKSALVIANGETAAEQSQPQSNGFAKNATLPRKDYFVSTPNLTTSSTTDLNGIDAVCITNATAMENINDIASEDRRQGVNGSGNSHEDDIHQVKQKNARNLYGGSVQNLSSVTTAMTSTPANEQAGIEFPEPSPRKRLLQLKRKSAAPAPPPRGSSMYAAEDSLSIGSTTPASVCSTPGSTPASPLTPASPDGHNTPPPDLPTTAAPTLTTAREISPKPLARESTTHAAATKPHTSSTPVLASDGSDVEIYATVQRREETSPNLSHVPKPVPRVTTTTTLLNATNSADSDSGINNSTTNMSTSPSPSTTTQHPNVSKVMLNRTPTPEPRSLSCEPPEVDRSLIAHLADLHENEHGENDDDAVSKQADSGIGEPIPSPIPDSLPSEGSAHECKSTFESSSDDDDMIKVYNFKLGKTVVKPLPEPKTLDDLTALVAAQSDSGETTPAGTLTQEATPTGVGLSDGTSWNFAIPISPPPNFADNAKFMENLDAEKSPDTPITPKIKERPVLNFEVLTRESGGGGGNVMNKAKSHDVVDQAAKSPEAVQEIQPAKVLPKTPATPLPSPSTPMNEIVVELATIINENRIDSLIRKVEDYNNEIESAKPNTLANFSITTISQQNSISTTLESTLRDEEKLYRKRDGSCNSSNTAKTPSPLLPKQRTSPIVTRADSFHHVHNTSKVENTTEHQQQQQQLQENGLNSRSSSYLSLTKLDQNGLTLNRRRSSSELSIGESPSLQSLEVIKTILNSRKNSLANSSDGETAMAKLASPEISTNTMQNGEKDYKSAAVTATAAGSESLKVTSVELKPKSNEDKAIVQNHKSIVAAVEQVAPVVETAAAKPKEVPKLYRYSGPPSINFSTWSERPKVQVAIKNEGDYIVGGKQPDNSNVVATPASTAAPATTTASIQLHTLNASIPRNYRASTPAGTFKFETSDKSKAETAIANEQLLPIAKTPPVLAPKPAPATINRMGIPEKEFQVPITVKPLKDVTVESVELRRQEQNGIEENKQTKPMSVTKVTLNGLMGTTAADVVEPKIRRPYSFYQYNAATIPRKADTNRFSTQATGPTLLRTTSITQLEANKPKSKVESGGTQLTTTAAAPPFGQNTLRKTGLKEKILAKEEAELQQQQQQQQQPTAKVSAVGSSATKSSHISPPVQQHKVFTTFSSSAAKQTHTVPPAPLAHSFANKNTTITSFINGYTPAHSSAQQQNSIAPAKTLQSAKLELKLQKSTNVYVNQTTATATTTKENHQPSTPKSAAVLGSPLAPPPPPAPAMLPLKSKSENTTPTVDTRDQLLEAIRNFKRGELNRT